ncbi:MAG TPA: hypothetical protein VIL64_05520, partial [Solirubrobacteraceae bacterium]
MRRLALPLVAALTLALPAVASAIVAGPNGDIAFTSDRSGNPDIWAIHADGTGARQLTTDPAP